MPRKIASALVPGWPYVLRGSEGGGGFMVPNPPLPLRLILHKLDKGHFQLLPKGLQGIRREEEEAKISLMRWRLGLERAPNGTPKPPNREPTSLFME